MAEASPPELLLERAHALVAEGALDGAVAVLRELLRQVPDAATVRIDLGVVLCALERFAEAEPELRLAAASAAAVDDDLTRALALTELSDALAGQRRLAEAIDVARRACARAPALPEAHLRLAEVAMIAAPHLALAAATRAGELAASGAAHQLRGAALTALGRLEEAIDAYRQAIALDPDTPAAPLATLLMRTGQLDEATALLRRLLAADPDNASVRHNLDAFAGAQPPAPPPGYAANLFDSYAACYDDHVVDTLGYRGHLALRTALGDQRGARGLDLGCGTGLVGALVRELVDELIGVDVSPRMIEQARARGVYDGLEVADAVGFLERPGPPFDLVAAGDVLGYLGDPAPVMAAVARRLAPDGRFAVTVERGEAPWRLERYARYSHAPDHLEALARQHGLEVTRREEIVLRRHEAGALPGVVLVARAPR